MQVWLRLESTSHPSHVDAELGVRCSVCSLSPRKRTASGHLQGATIAENTASLMLQAKCGFRVVGRRERISKVAGVWHDTILTERRSKKVGIE